LLIVDLEKETNCIHLVRVFLIIKSGPGYQEYS